ncbi:MAG: PEP-utilizing enzyme [Patescibacteria group bacterium]|nr:PEP-utilizing enzyme [Patescibacteria group bacterium]
MDLKNIKKHDDWVKMWSAKGSLHFDSHLGEIWTRRKNISGKAMYRQVIFIYQDGVTDCWATKSDRDDLGDRLSSLARKDKSYVVKISDDLQSCAENVLKFIDSYDANKLSLADFDEFWNLVYDYYLPHISVKYLVDYVSPAELKVILPVLERARLAAEPIYRKVENYVELIAERVARETSFTQEMIIATTKEELRSYFQNKRLPDRIQLNNRYRGAALIFDDKDTDIFTGEDVSKIEGMVLSSAATTVIEGQSAYQGKVTGRVKIVFDPTDPRLSFSEGDILVAGMTHPEFLPLLKKSAGFVTDSGGILSHAAISARELRKPCVIGTNNATKLLKDGDLIEVDANNGSVRILKKSVIISPKKQGKR